MLLNVTAAAAGIAERNQHLGTCGREIIDEQGGLCDGSVNRPQQRHTPVLLEHKSRDEGSGKVGGEKNTNW